MIRTKGIPVDSVIVAERDERILFWEGEIKKFVEGYGKRGALMEKTKPHIVIQVLMMLEQFETMVSIKKATGISDVAILAIRARYSETMTECRKQLSRKFAAITEMSASLLMKKLSILDEDEDQLSQTQLKDIALTMAIATDKGSQMDGMATVTIEHRKGASLDDAMKSIAEARVRAAAKLQTVEAEILD